MIAEILFLTFGLICLSAAFALAISRRLIRAAFWLFVVLISTGLLFAFVGANILTVSQIIVYVGGILILIVYGVMLTNRRKQGGQTSSLTNLLSGLMIILFLGAGISQLILELPVPEVITTDTIPLSNVQQIGLETMTRWLVPFEAVSVLLLVALIGAVFVARPDTSQP